VVLVGIHYGEDATIREGLQQLGVGYVLALKPLHSWWHPISEPGSLDEVARATPWQATAPGAWQAVDRTFRDGHRERWWALEIQVGLCERLTDVSKLPLNPKRSLPCSG
jgi:hypothetical protein